MTLDAKGMIPRRPYILRALYDWIIDNDMTPHVVVDATFPDTEIPREYVKDGQIVLNIDTAAVGALSLGDTEIEFSARFGGQPRKIRIPIGAVVAIYARENGAGTIFEPEEGLEPPESASPSAIDERQTPLSSVDALHASTDNQKSKQTSGSDQSSEGSEAPSKRPKKGKPNLKVIK